MKSEGGGFAPPYLSNGPNSPLHVCEIKIKSKTWALRLLYRTYFLSEKPKGKRNRHGGFEVRHSPFPVT